MLSGNERIKNIKHYLRTYKDGFVSIYALMILQVFMLFALLFTQMVTTSMNIEKHSKEELLDIFILESIKQHFKQENKEESIEDEHTIPSVNAWTKTYAGIEFTFVQDEDTMKVSYLLNNIRKEVHITLDETKQHIMNYEYQ